MAITKPTLKECVIGSTDVSADIIKVETEDDWGNPITTIKAVFKKSLATTLGTAVDENLVGNDFTFARGVSSATEDYLIKGEVTEVTTTPTSYEIIAADKMFRATKAEITKSYDKEIDTEAGVNTEIFKSLMNTYALITADSTTVTTSSDTITKFRLDHSTVIEAAQKLADRINYHFFYDSNQDKAYYRPVGAVNNGVTLTRGTGGNIINTPKWIRTQDGMLHELTIIGGESMVETTETFNGDTSTTTFTLTHKPANVRVEVGGTLQTGGKANITSTSYDYSVDEEKKQITFESGSIPGSGTNNISVTYSYRLIPATKARNTPAIALYATDSSGVEHPKKATWRRTDITEPEDVQALAEQVVIDRGSPFIKSTRLLVINNPTLSAGEQVTVVDSSAGINQALFVTKIKKYFPYQPDEVYVEDELFRKSIRLAMFDRITRLEEQTSRDQDILLKVELFPDTITFNASEIIQSASKESDTLYWDDETQGYWGGTEAPMTIDTTYASWGTDYITTNNDSASRLKVYADDSSDLTVSESDKTYMTWVRFNTLTAATTFLFDRYVWRLHHNGSYLPHFTAGRMTDGTGPFYSIAGTTTLTTGVWYHLTGVYHPDSAGGNGYIKLFVNGTQEGTTTPIGSLTYYQDYGGTPGSKYIRMGTSNHGTWSPADADFKDARIYEGELSETEIATAMNGDKVPEKSLIYHWKFDDGEGTTGNDMAQGNLWGDSTDETYSTLETNTSNNI